MFKGKYFKRIILLVIFIPATFFFVRGCYFPSIIKGEKIAAKLYGWEENLLKDSLNLKLHVFNTGMNKVSSILVGEINPWRPAPAFVIEHPKFGLIVFDTGLSTEIAKKGEAHLHLITSWLFKTRSLVGKDLPSQMKAVNLNPKEVTNVIFSHLHFDHIGNSKAFKNATFRIGKETSTDKLSRLDGLEPTIINSIKETHTFNTINFSSGVHFATFEKTVDLLGDGSLIAVQGNGHLSGSIGLFVNLPEGLVFLSGDEVVHFDWLYSDDVQRISKNPERAANIRNRVRMLLQLAPNTVVIPGHDLSRIPKNRGDIVLHNPELFLEETWPIN